MDRLMGANPLFQTDNMGFGIEFISWPQSDHI